MNFSS